MNRPRYTLASLLVLATLLGLGAAAADPDSDARVVAWLTVTPTAVLPGETVDVRVAFDLSGDDEPTTVQIAGSGLDGYPILSESTQPACSRADWTWTCSPPWPGRQSINLTVRVPTDAAWATSRTFAFTLVRPMASRFSVAESVWILGTRIGFDAQTSDGGNGTARQRLTLNITGPGPATDIWLSSVSDNGATIVSATPEPTQVGSGTASWFRQNLTRGAYAFEVFVACPSGTCETQATLQYADASGHVLPAQLISLASPPAAMPTTEPTSFVYLLLLASGLAVFTFLIGAHWLGYEVLPTPERYRSPREVYVIAKAGTLLAHRRRNGVPAKRDEDILAGMFTAVREFAKDAMGDAKTGLVVLSVGEERVTFVEGRQAVVAFVGAGRIGRGAVSQATSELVRLDAALEGCEPTSQEPSEVSEDIADILLR